MILVFKWGKPSAFWKFIQIYVLEIWLTFFWECSRVSGLIIVAGGKAPEPLYNQQGGSPPPPPLTIRDQIFLPHTHTHNNNRDFFLVVKKISSSVFVQSAAKSCQKTYSLTNFFSKCNALGPKCLSLFHRTVNHFIDGSLTVFDTVCTQEKLSLFNIYIYCIKV